MKFSFKYKIMLFSITKLYKLNFLIIHIKYQLKIKLSTCIIINLWELNENTWPNKWIQIGNMFNVFLKKLVIEIS